MAAPVGVWGVELEGQYISDQPPLRFSDEDPPDFFGWSGVRNSDVERPAGHGSISQSPDYFKTETKVYSFIVDEASEAAAMDRWQQVCGAFVPSTGEQELSIATQNGRYGRYGRIEACALVGDGMKYVRQDYTIEAAFKFRHTDPFWYGDPQVSVGTTGAVTGGFTFPHGFPQGFGTASVGGVTLNNLGTVGSRRLTVRIDANAGDVDQPELELITTGEILDFDLLIPSGSYLLVDFYTKRALLNGTSSRTSTLRFPQSRWPEIPPGTHTLRFGTSGAEAQLSATFRPAYIL